MVTLSLLLSHLPGRCLSGASCFLFFFGGGQTGPELQIVCVPFKKQKMTCTTQIDLQPTGPAAVFFQFQVFFFFAMQDSSTCFQFTSLKSTWKSLFFFFLKEGYRVFKMNPVYITAGRSQISKLAQRPVWVFTHCLIDISLISPLVPALIL